MQGLLTSPQALGAPQLLLSTPSIPGNWELTVSAEAPTGNGKRGTEASVLLTGLPTPLPTPLPPARCRAPVLGDAALVLFLGTFSLTVQAGVYCGCSRSSQTRQMCLCGCHGSSPPLLRTPSVRGRGRGGTPELAGPGATAAAGEIQPLARVRAHRPGAPGTGCATLCQPARQWGARPLSCPCRLAHGKRLGLAAVTVAFVRIPLASAPFLSDGRDAAACTGQAW